MMKQVEEDPDLMNNYFKAVQNKQKLIDFDKTDIARKNVYDGDTDWYELKNDVWQDDNLRNEALKNMMQLEDEEEFARKNDITEIDFITGEVTQKAITIDYKAQQQKVDQLIKEGVPPDSSGANDGGDSKGKVVENLKADKRMKKKEKQLMAGLKESYKDQMKKLAYKEVQKWKNPLASSKINHDDCYDNFKKALNVIGNRKVGLPEDNFDKAMYFLEKDDINCLSMWQPWASLVVHGIKRFEGRHWDTDFRGPLWIHAGSKQMSDEDIKAVEDQYRRLFGEDNLPDFPTSYPTGCLLGVVDLQDVITQETFKEYVPKKYIAESTSPHIFVVRNPRKLMTTIRLPGQKGVFQITEDLAESAIRNLKRVPTIWLPYFAENLPKNEAIEDQAAIDEESSEEIVQRDPSFKKVTSLTSIILLETIKPEEKIYKFLALFENQFAKVMEKSKEKMVLANFDEYVEGRDIMIEQMKFILQDIHEEEIDEDVLEGMMPECMVAYTVKQKSSKFDFRDNFKFLFCFGRSCELKYDGSKEVIIKNNLALTGLKAGGPMYLSFSRVLKTKKKGKFSPFPDKLKCDALLIGFY